MSPLPRLLLKACLLLVCLCLGPAAAAGEGSGVRDLEPLPRSVVFADPAELGAGRVPLDPDTDREIRGHIQRAFASLGTVEEARELIVRRYGLVAARALADILNSSKNVTELWNAALTVGAMRDVEGSAYELLPTLKPLEKVLGSGGVSSTNAMAALALGCFHFHQAELPARYRDGAPAVNTVPNVAKNHQRAAEALAAGRTRLANYLGHHSPFLRIAAMFGLAKMGGPRATEMFFDAPEPGSAHLEPRRAWLLASAFLGAPDAKVYERRLLGIDTKATQRTEEASAALAVAVALLLEEAPDWTRKNERLQKHLRGIGGALPEAQAERIFAQGVAAWTNQDAKAWQRVWDEALKASTDEKVAAAASQILVHCRLPGIERRMVDGVVQPQKTLHPPVQALVLLRAAADGRSEALPELVTWLKSKARRPTPNSRWDPRWYAAVGLLRALHHGRIKPKAERALVVEALRKAAKDTLDKGAALRDVLAGVLDVHGDKLASAEESSVYRLPAAELRRVESSFVCKYGLLEVDPVDATVQRVNQMAGHILGFENMPAWKPDKPNLKYQPQRYLKRHLKRYPYFSRLELRTERGRRPEPALPEGAKGIDR